MDPQERANHAMWRSAGHVASYATTTLRPAEAAVLERFAPDLTGSVLELGCGAGRVTGHLARLGGVVSAIDIAPDMVEYTGRAYPEVAVSVGDLRDLSALQNDAFSAVTLWFNLIDVLGHEARAEVLRAIARITAPGGLLVLDTHNLAHAGSRRRPTQVRGGSPRQLARSIAGVPVKVRNHRRLARFEQHGPGYAVLNDEAHRYTTLHYYVGRDEQARQLRAAGFEPVACFGADGQELGASDAAPDSPDLHYVARKPG